MNKFLLTAFLLCLLPVAGLKAESESVLDKPLDLKFTAVDGKKVDLSQMRGKVVLIDFWATWCGPCREEVPDVVATYKKYHDQGLEILGISLDQDKDTMQNFTDRNGMSWPQYFDGQGWDNDISSRFGVSQIPSMVLIGKDGKVVRPDRNGDLESMIKKLVKAP